MIRQGRQTLLHPSLGVEVTTDEEYEDQQHDGSQYSPLHSDSRLPGMLVHRKPLTKISPRVLTGE